jgi:hypothetical protein
LFSLSKWCPSESIAVSAAFVSDAVLHNKANRQRSFPVELTFL